MDYGRETLTLFEIDQPFCARTFGQAPCMASILPPYALGSNGAGTRKCFNTRATCQDPANFSPDVLRLRFSRPQEGLEPYGPLIPSLVDISTTPAAINLAAMDRSSAALGTREVLNVTLGDHLHSDLLVDKYRAERKTGVAQRMTDAYLSLPGISGNYASTPDSVLNSITGDMSIRVFIALTDWTPAAINTLLAKRSAAAAASTSYAFFVDPTGKLGFLWSDGTTVTTVLSTVAITAVDGDALWLRVEFDADDMSGGSTVIFATARNGEAFTYLGTGVTTAGASRIREGNEPLEIGSQMSGTASLASGKLYFAEVWGYVDFLLNPSEYLAFRFDPNAAPSDALTFSS